MFGVLKTGRGKAKAQVLNVDVEVIPGSGANGNGMAVNDAVIVNIKSRVSLGVFEEK